MAYHRELVFQTPLLSWQQVTLAAADSTWSDAYRVDGPRLLLPLTACFECRLGAASFVCDPSTALWLAPEEAYRLKRPWVAQRSMLFALDADFGPARRAAAPLAAHLRLGLWRCGLAQGTLEPLALEEQIAAWVHDLIPDRSGVAERPHRAVERAREYIAAAPQRDDMLADIAQAVHCSAFHLARVFRARTGQSLHGFRTRLRMAQALHRLREGERDLSALAADLGYSSHSHFSAVFRRSFGVPPGELRTNLAAPG